MVHDKLTEYDLNKFTLKEFEKYLNEQISKLPEKSSIGRCTIRDEMISCLKRSLGYDSCVVPLTDSSTCKIEISKIVYYFKISVKGTKTYTKVSNTRRKEKVTYGKVTLSGAYCDYYKDTIRHLDGHNYAKKTHYIGDNLSFSWSKKDSLTIGEMIPFVRDNIDYIKLTTKELDYIVSEYIHKLFIKNRELSRGLVKSNIITKEHVEKAFPIEWVDDFTDMNGEDTKTFIKNKCISTYMKDIKSNIEESIKENLHRDHYNDY